MDGASPSHAGGRGAQVEMDALYALVSRKLLEYKEVAPGTSPRKRSALKGRLDAIVLQLLGDERPAHQLVSPGNSAQNVRNDVKKLMNDDEVKTLLSSLPGGGSQSGAGPPLPAQAPEADGDPEEDMAAAAEQAMENGLGVQQEHVLHEDVRHLQVHMHMHTLIMTLCTATCLSGLCAPPCTYAYAYACLEP